MRKLTFWFERHPMSYAPLPVPQRSDCSGPLFDVRSPWSLGGPNPTSRSGSCTGILSVPPLIWLLTVAAFNLDRIRSSRAKQAGRDGAARPESQASSGYLGPDCNDAEHHRLPL